MQTLEKPVLFIGGGNMAHAILKGAVDAGVLRSGLVGVLDPSAERRSLFENSFDDPRASLDWLQSFGAQDGVVVVAVKPQMLGAVGEAFAPIMDGLGWKPLVVSILAGIPRRAVLGTFFGDDRAGRAVRVMPNTPAQVGMGMTAIASSGDLLEADLVTVESIFRAVGETVRLDESLMDAFTAVAGSGPAYVFYLVEAMSRAAEKLGFGPEDARKIVEQTVTGSSALLAASEHDASSLRQMVTSKNGTTYAATTTLDQRGVMDAFGAALTAARDRGMELGAG
ncbi:MAG: pyrroline-5-carboxylate reductase [Phycisphaerales bacterium]